MRETARKDLSKYQAVRVVSRIADRFSRPRSFHLVGLGTPKAGTHSLAQIFEDNYISYHETGGTKLIPLIIGYRKGYVSRCKIELALRARDWFLRPAVDVAHYYGLIPGLLSSVFPYSKYVILIRDCYTWLQSQVNQISMLQSYVSKNPTSKDHRAFLTLSDFYFGNLESSLYEAEDLELLQYRIPPIKALVSHWVIHNRRILEETPDHRRLVLRTKDFSRRLADISTFIGVDSSLVNQAKSHAYKREKKKINLWNTVNIGYVNRLVQELDPGIMEKYYPEIKCAEDIISIKSE